MTKKHQAGQFKGCNKLGSFKSGPHVLKIFKFNYAFNERCLSKEYFCKFFSSFYDQNEIKHFIAIQS